MNIDQQRADFEAEMEERHTGYTLEHENGRYRYSLTQRMWVIWQAAIALDRQGRGEPVAYLDVGEEGFVDLGSDKNIEELEALPPGRHQLYMHAPQPAAPVVKESLTAGEPVAKPVSVTQKWQDGDDSNMVSRVAEPVKVPSDGVLHELSSQFSRTSSEPSLYYTDTIGFARALLARYGQPAQQECGCCGRSDGCDPDCDAAQQDYMPVRQYYYQVSGCTADRATDPSCICWHDEGTGPLVKIPHYIKSWRNKPAQQDAEKAGMIERIASEWDGCIYDAGPSGDIDIGAAIRRAAALLEKP